MAEEEKEKKQEESKEQELTQEEPKPQNSNEESKEEPKTDKSDKKGLIRRLLPRLLIVVIIMVCAGAGFGLGQFLSGRRPAKANDSSAQDQSQTEQPQTLNPDSTVSGSQYWFYEMDPVVANLNEPGVTRYIRASLTLEMNTYMDIKQGTAFLDKKKPVLTNWLTIFLASLTLEDIRGDQKLRSIQSQICDAFNEKLYPNAKPQIRHILFREFAIQ